jgi:FKBP-type peptidyl-prolyl cis-trans isomerase
MVGMALAKQLDPIKDEIDVDMITKAIKTSLAGEKLLMTEDQARSVGEAFGQKMQAKQIAKAMADAKKNLEEGQKFSAENAKKPGVQTTASGLQYQVVTEGKGPKPKAATWSACITRAPRSTARPSTAPTTAASRWSSRSTRSCRAGRKACS